MFGPEEDAWTFRGDIPVVAHPPCRSWGQIRWRAKPEEGERNLATLCMGFVRLNGGVLEHPRGSSLLKAYNLTPEREGYDRWGGFTIEVNQFWWGHEALKRTWLYIVGCRREDLPEIPTRKGTPPKLVQAVPGLRKGMPGWRPEISKAARELTPPDLARWLVEVARRCAKRSG